MRRASIAAAAVLLSSFVDCAYAPRNIRTLAQPAEVATLDKRAPYLKAHLRDGSVYVLTKWMVDEASRTVTGEGDLLGPNRRVRESGPLTVPIASVALFEANLVPDSLALQEKTVVAGISGAVTLGCLAMPKACFGSCPSFYTSSSDGAGELLQAEGFSTSIAPSLEATDIDALYRTRVDGQRFEVQMRNEALETHVVRHVHLLAAPRPPGGRVIATQTGEFRQALDLGEPLSCAAAEGDCLPAVRAFDGLERVSRTDGTDLATRETIDVRFEGSGERLGLVIGARQTLLTTYLIYQTLAYMGTSASAWLAEFERSDPILIDRAHAIRDILGGIEVLVPDGNAGWTPAGMVHEVGPLGTDVKVVPLPPLAGPVHLRLRLTRGHWRLDFLALARLGESVTPTRLLPVEVTREGAGRVDASAKGSLTTLPGDAYRFVYRLPTGPEGYELFLESRGYYLEWLRQEWMAEENPEQTLRILWNPRQALVDLAPRFKEEEPALEGAFWRSRYVRQP